MDTHITIKPDSYTSLYLTGLGVTFEEMETLSEDVKTIADYANQHNQQFYNDAFVSLYFIKDWTDKNKKPINILVLDNLKKMDVDTSMVNLVGFFKEQIEDIMNTTNPATGLNAYIGKASIDKFAVFVIRNVDFLSGKAKGNAFTKALYRKEAAKNIQTILQKTLIEYREKHLNTNEKQHALLNRLKKEAEMNKEPEFIHMMRHNINKAKTDISNIQQEIIESMESVSSAFSSGTMDIPESQALDGLFSLFSEAASAANTATGVRRHGQENFLERVQELLPILEERGFKDKKLLSVLINLSSARGTIDPAMLVYVDTVKPMNYDVPKNMQAEVKLHVLAMKANRFNISIFDMQNFMDEHIRKTPILSHLGTKRWNLNIDVCHMIAKGYIAGQIYGEEEEAWETFKKVRNIVQGEESHTTLSSPYLGNI